MGWEVHQDQDNLNQHQQEDKNMASVFQKIGNFLNKDEVRTGLAIGSLAGGFGAFDGMKYGNTINKTLGGLNLASGLKAGGASGAAQAALGGYGLAQGFGKVGTFGNSYDSLMGSSVYGDRRAVGGNPIFPGGITDQNAASAKVNMTRLSPTSKYNFGGNANGDFRVNGTDNGFPSGAGRLQNDPSNFYGGQLGNNATSQIENPPLDLMGRGVERPDEYWANVRAKFPRNYQNGETGYKEIAGPILDYSGPINPNYIENNVRTNMSNGYLNQNQVGRNILTGGNQNFMNTGTNGTGLNLNTNNQSSLKNFSFEKVFDNIVTKAMKDPLQAVAVGSALVTVFADDPAEEAAKQYAAEMAKVRADTDPNSDFGQNYMSNFTERRTADLDDAYTKATSDFVGLMAKRGMMDSTIFTEGKASLDARFSELRAKIPMDSQVALQEYQKAQLTNINLGSQAAYRGGALQSAQTNPFSNSFQSAVASTTA